MVRRGISTAAKKTKETTTMTTTTTGTKGRKSNITTAATITSSLLVQNVIQGLHQVADPKTKDWFTNYVKGTTWIGCKVPIVRKVVKDVWSRTEIKSTTRTKTTTTTTKSKQKKNAKQGEDEEDDEEKLKKDEPTEEEDMILILVLDSAVTLLQQEECDVKLAGMILLSECMPIQQLVTRLTLQRLYDDVLLGNHVPDWSSADWFAMRVLRKIVFSEYGNPTLIDQVLNFTTLQDTSEENYTFVRRCGVVSFLQYDKPANRKQLPHDFGPKLIQACERSLLTSPDERFTQTGIAWVLRYVLLIHPTKQSLKSGKTNNNNRKKKKTADSDDDDDDDNDNINDEIIDEAKEAMEMIVRHGPLWTMEAKKSLVEKLSKNDPRRNQILKLGNGSKDTNKNNHDDKGDADDGDDSDGNSTKNKKKKRKTTK